MSVGDEPLFWMWTLSFSQLLLSYTYYIVFLISGQTLARGFRGLWCGKVVEFSDLPVLLECANDKSNLIMKGQFCLYQGNEYNAPLPAGSSVSALCWETRLSIAVCKLADGCRKQQGCPRFLVRVQLHDTNGCCTGKQQKHGGKQPNHGAAEVQFICSVQAIRLSAVAHGNKSALLTFQYCL